MKRKSLVAVLSIVLGALISNVHANVLHITLQGTISNGYDFAGIFGLTGQNLSGLSYTESITTNIDASQWNTGSTYGSTCGFSQPGAPKPGFTDTVTVNGRAFTVAMAASNFQCLLLQDGVSTHAPFSAPDEILSMMDGYTAGNVLTYYYLDISSYSIPFIPSVALNQSFTVPVAGLSGVHPVGGLSGVHPVGGLSGVQPIPGFSTVRSEFAYGITNFSGDVTNISIDGTVVEPASIATLGLGLAGLAAIRRKSSKKK